MPKVRVVATGKAAVATGKAAVVAIGQAVVVQRNKVLGMAGGSGASD